MKNATTINFEIQCLTELRQNCFDHLSKIDQSNLALQKQCLGEIKEYGRQISLLIQEREFISAPTKTVYRVTIAEPFTNCCQAGKFIEEEYFFSEEPKAKAFHEMKLSLGEQSTFSKINVFQ